MEKINVVVNGKTLELAGDIKLSDILLDYFSHNAEFVIQRNFQLISFGFNSIKIEDNDILEIISYNLTDNNLQQNSTNILNEETK